MNVLRLSLWRLSDAWVRSFATSKHWVLVANSVTLPCFWYAAVSLGPRFHDALHAYDGGRLALLLASLLPCLWIALFSQRLYAMPSRAQGWLTHDFHFLLCQPLPLGRVLGSMAAVWTLGELPVVVSTVALLAGFLRAVGASWGLAALTVGLFYWMVFDAFLLLALGRLLFHAHQRPVHRLAMAACALALLAAAAQGLAPLPEPEAPELALAWARQPVPEPETTGMLLRLIASAEPALAAYRTVSPLADWFPPFRLLAAVEALAVGDPAGWSVLLVLAAMLSLVPIAVALVTEPLSRSGRLALVAVAEEEPASRPRPASVADRRWPTGLDAKELQLWAQFWVAPAALAMGAGYLTWYLLTAGYTVLATAKMLGIATWMVGGLAGDSLGWERRGLVLCQLLPFTPSELLGAKARWAALVGLASLVVPFAAVCVAADAEPFGEVVRGAMVLTFLVFVAAHAGVALGALMRDLSGQGQPAMGALLGAMLWLGLCAAMVAQVFFTSSYAVFGGLFFDVLLVVALWQRACLQVRFQHDPEEVVTLETTFADAVVVFLTSYLLVTLLVLRAQALGAMPGALESLRAYLLTALFPAVLAALSWSYLRHLPVGPGRNGLRRTWRGDLLAAALVAFVTVTASLAYSYGTTRLGLVEKAQLEVSVKTMRSMVEGLPAAPLLMVLLVAGLAPLAEEAFFRGLFYTGVRRLQPHDWRIAVLFSALAFGLLHPAAHFPVLFMMGLLLAALVEWRGSLRPAILAHCLHNGVIFAIFTLSRG